MVYNDIYQMLVTYMKYNNYFYIKMLEKQIPQFHGDFHQRNGIQQMATHLIQPVELTL